MPQSYCCAFPTDTTEVEQMILSMAEGEPNYNRKDLCPRHVWENYYKAVNELNYVGHWEHRCIYNSVDNNGERFTFWMQRSWDRTALTSFFWGADRLVIFRAVDASDGDLAREGIRRRWLRDHGQYERNRQ